MEVLVILVFALAVWFVLWGYKVPKEPEEEENPCDTCTRWYECNGVDEECPRRK